MEEGREVHRALELYFLVIEEDAVVTSHSSFNRTDSGRGAAGEFSADTGGAGRKGREVSRSAAEHLLM